MLPTPSDQTSAATAGLETGFAAAADGKVVTLLLTTPAAALSATRLSDDVLPVLGVLIWFVALLVLIAADVSPAGHHVHPHPHRCSGHRPWRPTHQHVRAPR